MAFTSIDQLVRHLCRATGEPDYKNYDSILSHVRGALIDLNLYVTPNVKIEYVSLNNLRNINWPSDCLRPLRVVLEREGIQRKLPMRNQGIPPQDDRDIDFLPCQEEINRLPPQNLSCSAEFEEAAVCDLERRIVHINFKPQKGDKFLLAYSPDKISEGVSVIPVEMETPIEEWVFWKYFRMTNLALSDRGRANYKEEYGRLKKLYQQPNLEQLIDFLIARYS